MWFLEVLGAVTAILFGVFGAMSWKAASEANQKSDIANDRSDAANLVALVALCAQLTTGDDAQVGSLTRSTPAASLYMVKEGVLRVRRL